MIFPVYENIKLICFCFVYCTFFLQLFISFRVSHNRVYKYTTRTKIKYFHRDHHHHQKYKRQDKRVILLAVAETPQEQQLFTLKCSSGAGKKICKDATPHTNINSHRQFTLSSHIIIIAPELLREANSFHTQTEKNNSEMLYYAMQYIQQGRQILHAQPLFFPSLLQNS